MIKGGAIKKEKGTHRKRREGEVLESTGPESMREEEADRALPKGEREIGRCSKCEGSRSAMSQCAD